MKIDLCSEKLSRVSIYITAEIMDGKLRISGQDIGEACNDIFGENEYEYFYNFDKENTDKLYYALNKKYGENILHVLKDQFSGVDCCEKLREFCNEHDIKFSFTSF